MDDEWKLSVLEGIDAKRNSTMDKLVACRHVNSAILLL